MKNIFCVLLVAFVSLNIWANDDFEIRSQSEFIPDFKNKFSGSLNINPSATSASSLKNISLSYSKSTSENNWLDFNFIYSMGNFNKFTTNNPSATTMTTIQTNDFTNTSTETTIGVGYSLLTTYTSNLTGLKDFYEIASASATYNLFKESQLANTFTGPGLNAKFSLLKKISNYVSIGGNLNYNLAVVKRAQNLDSETSSSRSLTLSHLTIGLELSLFL